MKNVLEVINLFSSAKLFIGGRFSFLQEKGLNMHLICSPSPELNSFTEKLKIKSKAVCIERQISPIKDIVALIEICKYIRRNNINIIVGHQAKGVLLAVLAGKIMNVQKIIIFAHGILFETTSGIKRKIFIWESRLESICAHKIVCVSESVARVRRLEKIDKKEKQVILGKGTCGGIDTVYKFNPELINLEDQVSLKKKYKINDSDFVIGFSGRLVKDKGIIELIKAFKLIKKRRPDENIKLMIIGGQEKRDSIPQELIDYFNEASDIICTGHIDGNVELYYSLFTILVLPSYREGFPTIVLEASSMKIPVLTTKKTGCIDSIIENETGFYVDITPESIADGIEKLFDSELRRKMGEKGRSHVVENYDHSKVWPYVEILYKGD
ncbi:glycosyltransferase [Bacteroidales bacterium OttesenSCG-928-M06]|nr:glycosyltransferase [Bacteroidales bacterium OttesenSCG-928-M06]